MAIYLQEREGSAEKFRLPDWNKARGTLEETGLVKKIEPSLVPSSDEIQLHSIRSELQEHAAVLPNSDSPPPAKMLSPLPPDIPSGSALAILHRRISKKYM